MNTPTPRTDFAIKASNGQWSYVLKLCAEELERELTAAREKLKAVTEQLREALDNTPWHSNGETKEEWFDRQREKYEVISRELTAVTEQLKAAQDGWHDEITKGLSELRRAESIYTQAQERAERAEEQRDRLAEALKQIQGVGLVAVDAFDELDRIDEIVDEALQSLNQPTP